MNIEQIREYCLQKPFTTESLPFDDTSLVFKVHEKMFGLLILKHPHRMNLKCDPEIAIKLRETYDFVIPGYHMNKKHWNTLSELDNIPDDLIIEWINHSYQLVWNKLPKRLQSKSENE
ncbi:MmcQ/YjbR family DNA-binding protein [Halosquirtibacter xylanolyticus]|uniref:MmcQ/YjbR family DNA-binding protein n=1 Tax=Halosquirtibacter xylanolyticus TaxID=3374599 RepID=UPI00374925DE|nr:MmcQ/YjbR family DNA-binding protein [Prolixibacteraceae bacterium]